jgi:hypothetical protein
MRKAICDSLYLRYTLINTRYAVALSKITLPALDSVGMYGSMVLALLSSFAFALCEHKNERQKKKKERCENRTWGTA